MIKKRLRLADELARAARDVCSDPRNDARIRRLGLALEAYAPVRSPQKLDSLDALVVEICDELGLLPGEDQLNELRAKLHYFALASRDCYVVMKGGLYYRPEAKGYTNRIEDAGRYTKAEAESHCDGTHGEVTMKHIGEAS